ncbi:MAG: type II toxin-antitoxin system RelB/DinJ family antitoxin [Lachnospiraceae bacterium]|nr:type II toxin-antitoxin system RelB/DinJ family antitoxin [Lachnospiraceae bacterium]
MSIDEDIKPKAQAMLAEFGLDLSTAVNMFLRQMLREKAIPFEIRQEIPNADTLAAMAEVEEMEKHPELARTYSSVDEFMEDLLK